MTNRARSFVLALALVPVVATSTVAQETEASQQLHQLFEDAWEYTLQENPLFATFVGDDRYNDRLGEATVEAAKRQAEKNREFLARLAAIDKSALSRTDQVNYDIFERLARDEIVEHEFRQYLMPVTNRTGFHIFFPQLPEQVSLKDVQDYEDYIARLNGFHEWTQQHIELMRLGLEQDYVLPAVVLEGYEGTIEPHIVEDPTESRLYAPFESFPGAINEEERARLTAAGREAIMSSVVPGFRAFLEFMNEEYLPGARESIGASALPNGKAFYEHRIRRFTTLDVTPRQVHERGLAEVERIRTEMQAIINQVEFEGGFDEFLEFLRTDEGFYADTKDELLKEVAYALKRMDGRLPELFGKLPRMSYGIKEVPEYVAPRTTTAYYQPPAGDGSRAGFYYVNTYDLPSRPLYEVQALSFHEAVPGHHLQIALQQEMEGIPAFRRFAGFTAFVEGWALYSERLGKEVGFYSDPYSDFGRLTYEMWRACRLVVDPGMHYLGWTRQQAIDFMAENSALSLHNIRSEVDRYIAWPGQAVAYKTGELKIRELRERAESALGAAFDVREFHDVVLGSGAVPLTVLDANVNAYIAEKQKT